MIGRGGTISVPKETLEKFSHPATPTTVPTMPKIASNDRSRSALLANQNKP
jgi:hypothetical protein